MNRKIDQADCFLKMWRDVAIENPEIDFTQNENMIYHYLTRLNVPLKERNVVLDNYLFPKWLNRYSNINNIRCRLHGNNYFCAFFNEQGVQKEYIKVYIPLDSEHIYDGANKILDYLTRNNIKHQSKVAKHIRFDNFVVRLHNIDDLDNLINFVNSDAYIKEGLLEPNPFVYTKNGLAVVCDGHISYNTTMAKFISIYIQARKINGQLNNIDIQDFKNYLNQYYKEVFLNKDYDRFVNDFKNVSLENNDFVNYQQVLALIIKSLNPEFTYRQYKEHYKMCTYGNSNCDYLVEEKPNFINNNVESSIVESHINVTKAPNQTLEILLLDALSIMSNKYGRDNAIKSIQKYLVTNNARLISRDNNLRQRIVNSNFAIDLSNVLNSNNLTLEQYISLLEQKNNLPHSNEECLTKALVETYNKYEPTTGLGREYMINALRLYVISNSSNGFTRDNGARNLVINNLTPYDVINILNRKYGQSIDMEEACITYVDDMFKVQKNLLK